MNKDYLQIEVEKNYPGFQLVAEFTVSEGEFFSLVGPSGCGKTTLLRLISGLEQPDRGRIILDGWDVTAVSPADRKIGLVFQDYALFPHLTVAGNIEYGLKVRRLPVEQRRARVEELLALFEIEGLKNRNIQELSGGERQRVALARALAPQPCLLLMDEPFAALDYGIRRRLRRELRELQERLGFTTIFVTHQQEEALSLSARLAVMKNGRIMQIGTAAEVYCNPVHSFVAEFLGDANLIPCEVQSTDAGITITFDEATVFTMPGSKQKPGSYLLMIRPEDVMITDHTPLFTGELVTLEYLGHGYYLEVKTTNGLLLKMVTGKEEQELVKGRWLPLTFRSGAPKLIPIKAQVST
ncbi:MAG: ABC transporter ATP-binding protein [Firmicutes bacterium]|nr:ABC transporter ATP-binding protein [Bacillota bacterium]